ncbi:RHS repeat-associated core domain-containing protein [Photorhabdus khanii]|uniref:RHS repeat-associated core domain-containing protein n=1 Tax=Photorhabdus khanii subsp. guanajuatensis TaxID=2100166 RepID=A0A4R4JU83_9GAMM|nr:RHS repeat-associated core domain-containing protein [Photorhabdus khanii]TDB58198.1 hypothetical protein C5467_10530 [Photorhabdus khanii subsp. guanajuatensis]
MGQRNYHYDGTDKVTRPDNTVLEALTSENGNTLTIKTDSQELSTLAFDPPSKTLSVATHQQTKQEGALLLGPCHNKLTSPGLLGNTYHTLTTPRGTSNASESRSLAREQLAGRRLDGSYFRHYRDRLNRLIRMSQNGLDYHYHYNAAGQLHCQTVTDPVSGVRLSTKYSHDEFGQETMREYELNGKNTMTLTHSWLDNGLLSEKKLSREGIVQRTETFVYDNCDRLTDYHCQALAGEYPADESGKPLTQQHFTWDSLNNLKTCTTTFTDKSQRIQRYTYDTANPTRRLSVTTEFTAAKDSQAPVPETTTVKLSWDKNGYITQDERGNKLTYTSQGQLESVKDSNNKLLTYYIYDGFNRMVAQYIAATEQTCELRYDGDVLCGEIWFDKNGVVKQVMLGDNLVQQTRMKDTVQTAFILNDPHSGTVGSCQPDTNGTLQSQYTSYTPFGDNGAALATSCAGFNGARRDPVTGCYHLGNGYRTYDPAQMSWRQPDSLSPFGEGGINDYAYCGGDPVNRYDPSGHIMLSRWGQNHMIASLEQALRETRPLPVDRFWRGLMLSTVITAIGVLISIPTGGASLMLFGIVTALSVTALGLEIAGKFLEESHPELAKALGIASMVFGFASIIPSLGTILKQSGRLLRWAGNKIGQIAERVEKSVHHGLEQWRTFRIKYPTFTALMNQELKDIKKIMTYYRWRLSASKQYDFTRLQTLITKRPGGSASFMARTRQELKDIMTHFRERWSASTQYDFTQLQTTKIRYTDSTANFTAKINRALSQESMTYYRGRWLTSIQYNQLLTVRGASQRSSSILATGTQEVTASTQTLLVKDSHTLMKKVKGSFAYHLISNMDEAIDKLITLKVSYDTVMGTIGLLPQDDTHNEV